MTASTLRNKIKAKLDTLVTSGDLSLVLNRSFKHHPLADPNLVKFPAAIVQPPSFESTELDQAANERTYTFDIVIVMKGDDISSIDAIENLAETISNAFDDDFTLDGAAQGGVSPAVSPIEQDEFNGKQLVMFVVTIKPRICYNINS
jgi:hypothetical protein